MKANTFSVLLLLVVFFSLFPFGDGVAGTLQDVKARGKLIVGVKTDFPPFGFLDKKRVNRGFDIDIAKALSKELFGNEDAVHFVSVTSENRIPFLTSGKIDLVAATLTITGERKGEVVAFTLSGRIKAKEVAELQRLFEVEGQDHRIVLDLKEVKLVDREAVRFLARCEANGIQLENCPAYIREWIVRKGPPMEPA